MIDVRCETTTAVLADEAAYRAAFAALPDWRRRKAESFRFVADRRRSVAAWLLLCRMLAERGIDAAGLSVSENEFGKPWFVSRPDVCFSISHAGDRVMAAVADSPVGCDVERIGPIGEGVAERCLSPDELQALYAIPNGPERERLFFRLWVRKESYSKSRGFGLALDFPSFSVLGEKASQTGWFKDYDFGDGYLGCVSLFRRG